MLLAEGIVGTITSSRNGQGHAARSKGPTAGCTPKSGWSEIVNDGLTRGEMCIYLYFDAFRPVC